MSSESNATARRAGVIYDRLQAHYSDAHCALDFTTPYELLVATILSAQCTDKRVNMVTPTLFKRYPTPEALAAAKPEELEDIIKSTGFFRSKAKNLIGMATAVTEQYGGAIPDEMDSLVTLPGVGRKTANVLLGNAFDKNIGVVVDTHVGRVSHRLGLTTHSDPVKVEQDLMSLFPRDNWTMLSHLLIEHGRQICEARRPKCEICFLNDICPYARRGGLAVRTTGRSGTARGAGKRSKGNGGDEPSPRSGKSGAAKSGSEKPGTAKPGPAKPRTAKPKPRTTKPGVTKPEPATRQAAKKRI